MGKVTFVGDAVDGGGLAGVIIMIAV